MPRSTRRTGAAATILLVAVVVLLLLASMVLFTVDFTEHVLVQTFGRTTRVLSGEADAGLHARIPFVQRLVRYDARTFVFEDTMNELATNDKQNITLTTFCAWRIKEPRRFQREIKTVEAAREGIRTRLRAAKSAVIGKRRMAELVNTDPARMHIVEIEEEILAAVAEEVLRDYGAEVMLIGIKSLGLPETVSDRVIESMKKERQKEADRYESTGEAEALAIRERAREAREQILAFAERKAGEIRAQGDAAAAEWYKEFEKNPRLAAFLRSLKSLKKELTGRTVFLLDGSQIPAVRFFREGAHLPELPSGVRDAAGDPNAPPAATPPRPAPATRPATRPAARDEAREER